MAGLAGFRPTAAAAKRLELIQAAKEAERQALGVKVEAEAEKLRAEASRVRFEVEAAGKRAVNEAANLLSSENISLQAKLELLKVLPDIIREAARPMEAIDSIKIVQVDGLTGSGGGGKAVSAGGEQNLAQSAVAAALRYRAQAPVVDGLMKELGLDGSSLDSLVKGAAAEKPAVTPAAPKKPD